MRQAGIVGLYETLCLSIQTFAHALMLGVDIYIHKYTQTCIQAYAKHMRTYIHTYMAEFHKYSIRSCTQ